MDLSALREEYRRTGLRREELAADPVEQFRGWFEQVRGAGLREPNAMVLATVGEGGRPSTRTVLLKAFDTKGFVFYTNYASRKAREIAANPRVCLQFLWLELERQVLIEGTAAKISRAESLRYFLSRPRGSQLGAWVSQQSEVVSSRSLLELQFEKMKQKFGAGEVPLPDFWGGYRVAPERFEFWQGRANRLHDRFAYTPAEGGSWETRRLSP